MFFSNDKNKLIVYLNELLSIENAVIKRLHRRTQQTSLPNSRNILQDQLQEEKEQQSKLENLIADYWGKVTEKIADKNVINILKQNLQEKESTYANITTSESKMLSDMRKDGDPVNELFSLGSAVADMLTPYWNSKENPTK